MNQGEVWDFNPCGFMLTTKNAERVAEFHRGNPADFKKNWRIYPENFEYQCEIRDLSLNSKIEQMKLMPQSPKDPKGH